MGKLILRYPDGSTREIPLERERLTIGRRADNDVCLPFPAVSAEHAAVVTILDDSFLEDLGSTNGTLVNGRAITKHFLRDQDEIEVGRHTLVYVSGDYTMPPQTSIAEPMTTVAVTENGGATIGDDGRTVVPPPRRRTRVDATTNPINDATPSAVMPASFMPTPEIRPQELARTARDVVARSDAPVDAPMLEVMDGPSAGDVVQVGREDFVIGRVGLQIAAVRRTPEGFRLVQLEGDSPPRMNGASLPSEGALLAAGDEIEIAGRRLRYRALA